MRIKVSLLIILLIALTGCKSQQGNILNSNAIKVAPNSTTIITDSLEYVRNIRTDNKQKYIGKEFNVLLSDLEIPVKSYYSMAMNKINYAGIIISFDDPVTTRQKFNGDRGLKNPLEIFIEFDRLISVSEVLAAFNNTAAGEWSLAHENFFSKFIVKKIN